MKEIKIIIFMISVLFPSCFVFDVYSEPSALILSGGGARGAYQIGVWKALIDLDIEIGAVYGVSVGAINAAVIASGDFETAKSLWLGISKTDVMKISKAGEHVLSGNLSLRDLFTAVGEIYINNGIDVSPLREILEDTVDEERIRSSDVDFGLLTFSLTDLKTEYVYISGISEGELVDYILASANFPLFQRQVIDEKVFIDGGVYKNLPVEMVDPEQYRQAILITLNLYTAIDMIDSITNYNSYDLEVEIISPSGELGSLLDFNASNSRRLMIMGYLDALREFGAVCGNVYFLSCRDDVVSQLFSALNPEEMEEACELLGVRFVPNDPDYLYSEIIVTELYKVIKHTNGSDSTSEDNVWQIGFLEEIAERAKVDHLEFYSPAGLFAAAVGKYIARDDFSVYYDRYLDFISYLWLKSQYRLKFQLEPEGQYEQGLRSFSLGEE